jgi:hypothetical protein
MGRVLLSKGINPEIKNKNKLKLLTAKSCSLEYAKNFAESSNRRRPFNGPLREIVVVINAPTNGYLVCELGFAVSNGFKVVR